MKAKPVEAKNSPVQKFRCGNVSSAIFGKAMETDGRKFTVYSANIVKNYTVEENGKTVWKSTSSFNRNDLVKLQIVTNKTLDWMYSSDDKETDEELF